MDTIQIQFGHQNFANYQRLSYRWWYALAEFVDNSTQSYYDNKDALDKRLKDEADRFTVTITTDKDFIRVHDNAMGMNRDDLTRALVVGQPPLDSSGRCRYGMGMKTAACWIGNSWDIVTTKFGDSTEYKVNVNVVDVANGNLGRDVQTRTVEPEQHYTRIEISEHHRPLRGRTVGKIKQYLSSIYRVDISKDHLVLKYDDVELEWPGYSDEEFLSRKDGTRYKRDFIFEIPTSPDSKVVEGWVGVLQKGSRGRAGFSILHRSRLIKGWPDSWRPESIYGAGGRNDLINQRLVGEVNLEDFEVSHTKDEINWHGDEEELVEEYLKKECERYMEAARKARKGQPPGHGPEQVHVDAAVRALEEELATREFVEKLNLEDALPSLSQIESVNKYVVDNALRSEPQFVVSIGDMSVKVFLDPTGSPNDPYYVNEDHEDSEVIVVINIQHPHWSMLEGENAVENYLRHCVYDGIAEYRANRKHRLEPDTIKSLKDKYLRVAFEVLQAGDDSSDD